MQLATAGAGEPGTPVFVEGGLRRVWHVEQTAGSVPVSAGDGRWWSQGWS